MTTDECVFRAKRTAPKSVKFMSEKPNESVTPETVGQQPQWPGDKLRTPGTKDKVTKKVGDMELTEETRIPVLPNHPTATGQ